jgi:hypothetical protein
VGTDKRARQKANRDRARQERIRKQKMSKVRKRGLVFGVGIPAIVVALFLVARLAGGDDASVESTTTAPPVTNSAGIVEGQTECPKTD